MYIVKLTYVISNRASYMQVSKLLERRKKKIQVLKNIRFI